jgi:hypothetical protein
MKDGVFAIVLVVVIVAVFLVATNMMLTGEGIGWLIP